MIVSEEETLAALTPEEYARYVAEAEAVFAALDYGYDNAGPSYVEPKPLPIATIVQVRKSLWSRLWK